MKRHELLRHLRRNGCALLHEGARHSIYRSTASGRLTAPPRHAEIANDLARMICRDLGIPPP
jgi:mRNA interferase HicA